MSDFVVRDSYGGELTDTPDLVERHVEKIKSLALHCEFRKRTG